MNLQKSAAERFVNALLFEVLAIAICAPVGAWLLGHSLAHMGALTLMISLIAMAWNMVFNALFDRTQRRWGFTRNLKARAVHALLFEIGLLLVIVPLAAWWLGMSLWHAFVLDIGIALFFMPYTFVFNWLYDKFGDKLGDKMRDRVRDKLSARRLARKNRQSVKAACCDPEPVERF